MKSAGILRVFPTSTQVSDKRHVVLSLSAPLKLLADGRSASRSSDDWNWRRPTRCHRLVCDRARILPPINATRKVTMQDSKVGFLPLAAKAVVCHTITYFIAGALAFKFLHYSDFINNPNSGMKPTTSMWVLLGAPLQIFRGVLFASVFYPFREQLFGWKPGWLLMAWMLIAIGILGTFGAPGGSLEGYIYTTIPWRMQMRGYLEIVPQALLLSALLCYWVRRPVKWMAWTLGTLYVICVGLPILGLLAPRR
jgi:hypothetical protein